MGDLELAASRAEIARTLTGRGSASRTEVGPGGRTAERESLGTWPLSVRPVRTQERAILGAATEVALLRIRLPWNAPLRTGDEWEIGGRDGSWRVVVVEEARERPLMRTAIVERRDRED